MQIECFLKYEKDVFRHSPHPPPPPSPNLLSTPQNFGILSMLPPVYYHSSPLRHTRLLPSEYEFDFFCMLLGIHKYIYIIQSIHVGVVKHTWACQK